jgi:hypothetical protein
MFKKSQAALDFLVNGFWFFIFIIGVTYFAISYLNAPEANSSLCYYTERITPIYSLSMNDKMQGMFFIGIGYIGEQPYYYFYEQSSQGGKILAKLLAEETVIQETNSTVPSKVEYIWTVKSAKCGFAPDYRKVELYVPTDTIKKEFNVNTQTIGN